MSEKMAQSIDPTTLLDLTAKIVSAYAGNAKLSATELTETINSVSRALAQISAASLEPEKKELEARATFCATREGVAPQTLEVRAWTFLLGAE